MKKYIFLMAIVAMMCSCSGNKFKVKGNVEGAGDSTTVYLEYASNGEYMPFDSAKVDGSGDYSFSEPAAEFPNIYRLRCDNKFVYFTVDSIETVTVNSKLKTFDTDFTLDGTDHVKQVMEISKQLMKYNGKATTAQLDAWKHELASKYILTDPAGIVAYYIINLYVNGQPLFNAINDFDFKIIGAVANGFNSFKPNDPRTNYLVNMTIEGQRARRAASGQTGQAVQAELVKLIDINLQDVNGKSRSLKAEAGKGKVLVLNFTNYEHNLSPAFNKILNDLYTQYKGKLEIYQVGLDTNVSEWNAAAKNLPWITVFDPNGEQSKNVSTYNVRSYFTTFIINQSGEISERIDDPISDAKTLPNAVAKYMK